jgi:adenine-specific DNA-methyltransferase
MTKVFIGGSRTLSRLNPMVLDRIDSIAARHLPIVVGDANGADKAVQRYLNSKGYRDVEVFCSGTRPRNNVGQWTIRTIDSGNETDRREHFTVKDRAMARASDFGFMLWDGESLGTILNVFRLVSLGKKALIYLSPTKEFVDVVSMDDWERTVRGLPPALAERINRLLKKEPIAVEQKQSAGSSVQQELSF